MKNNKPKPTHHVKYRQIQWLEHATLTIQEDRTKIKPCKPYDQPETINPNRKRKNYRIDVSTALKREYQTDLSNRTQVRLNNPKKKP